MENNNVFKSKKSLIADRKNQICNSCNKLTASVIYFTDHIHQGLNQLNMPTSQEIILDTKISKKEDATQCENKLVGYLCAYCYCCFEPQNHYDYCILCPMLTDCPKCGLLMYDVEQPDSSYQSMTITCKCGEKFRPNTKPWTKPKSI